MKKEDFDFDKWLDKNNHVIADKWHDGVKFYFSYTLPTQWRLFIRKFKYFQTC